MVYAIPLDVRVALPALKDDLVAAQVEQPAREHVGRVRKHAPHRVIHLLLGRVQRAVT
jgi:hypothetical protein